MTAHAAILVTLDPGSTTFQDADDFVVKAQELGACQPTSRPTQFLLHWEDTNLWKVAAVYSEARTALDEWVRLPDLDEAEPGSNTDHGKLSVWTESDGMLDRRIIPTLRNLRDGGYQPMYNGRPSCPFCSSFVDDEETHNPSCPLLTLP